MSAPTTSIRLAYRQLLTHGYRAVKFSKPARYMILERLRFKFRDTSPAESIDPVRFDRTLEFLRLAAKYNGAEHKLLRNLTHCWYQHTKWYLAKGQTPQAKEIVYDHYQANKVEIERNVRELGRTLNIYI